MKNNFKLLIIGIIMVIAVLLVSVRIKNRVDTVSKGTEQGNEQTGQETIIDDLDVEVGPTLTDKQVEEAIEYNKEMDGFHYFFAPEDL